jgi:hypothetical protein
VAGCFVVGEPQITYQGGVVVAKTLRVLFTWRAGKPWQKASEKAQAKALEKWRAMQEQWKQDPGIQFICAFDCDGHNVLFEVDDVSRYHEMSNSFFRAAFPIQEAHFKMAMGDTETDKSWTS